MVVSDCDLGIREAEAGGQKVHSQQGLHGETLSHTDKEERKRKLVWWYGIFSGQFGPCFSGSRVDIAEQV